MGLRRFTVLLALACFAAGAGSAEPLPDERVAAYREFRTAFDAGNYQDALPHGIRVVELTRSQFGDEAPELLNPMSNLGTTYYRLRQYEPAMDTFRATLKLLDQESDSADERLVRPLLGLGLSLRALGRDEEAVVPLKRALDITRNREGLFALSQLPLQKQLIAAYMATQRLEEAGREQQYAFTVAETAYGKNDVRLLAPLDDLARWNEAMGRYSMARLLHVRAVQTADSAPGSTPVLAVNGLRGIARSYRLGYVYGETEEAAASAANASAADNMLQRAVVGPSGEGERALRVAIERLRAASPVDSRTLGEVQADLGDWYLTAGSPQRAIPQYRDAWNTLNSIGASQLLAQPVALTYRPPSVAVSRGPQDPDRYAVQDVDLRLGIDAQGVVRSTVVTNAAAERESAERAVSSAVRRTQFRPAMIGGEPAATTDTPFRERVWVKLPDPDKE